MTARIQPLTPARHAAGLARMTRQFFLIAVLTLCGAWGLAQGLIILLGRSADTIFPVPFLVSTLLLLIGSARMNEALGHVRRERQPQFRQSLVKALVSGGLFMGVQTYALWTVFPASRTNAEASLGVTGFAVAVTALHGFHFLVATLFVSFVTVRAWGDRYDHEYYWGVTVCAWFWHALGIVWLAILAVYAISSLGAVR